MATYSFDEQSVKRIGEAVRKVERMGGDRNQPPVQYETQTESFRTVIRGQFSGVWAKDTDADVTFTADNGDSKTKTATNYFADVGTAGNTTDCIIMLVGSEWVLVGATPQTECLVINDIVPSGYITIVSNVACVDGDLVVTTDTFSLEDLASVTSLNLTLPPQSGCS